MGINFLARWYLSMWARYELGTRANRFTKWYEMYMLSLTTREGSRSSLHPHLCAYPNNPRFPMKSDLSFIFWNSPLNILLVWVMKKIKLARVFFHLFFGVIASPKWSKGHPIFFFFFSTFGSAALNGSVELFFPWTFYRSKLNDILFVQGQRVGSFMPANSQTWKKYCACLKVCVKPSKCKQNEFYFWYVNVETLVH